MDEDQWRLVCLLPYGGQAGLEKSVPMATRQIEQYQSGMQLHYGSGRQMRQPEVLTNANPQQTKRL